MAFVILDPVITVHPGPGPVRGLQQGRGSLCEARRGSRRFRARRETGLRHDERGLQPVALPGLAADAELPRDPAEHRPGGREVRHDRPRARCWRSRSACPTRGCEASSRSSRRPHSRATGSTSRRWTCTTPCATCGCNADRKGQRRGLRIELVPGEPPRLVLEPWNVVIPATAGTFKGKAARVVRVWGRRRLSLICIGSSRSRKRSRSTCWAAACRASGSCVRPA